ncbi:hypothetical protein ACFL35_02855 [Candidatus Riflebacteria bacterium]
MEREESSIQKNLEEPEEAKSSLWSDFKLALLVCFLLWLLILGGAYVYKQRNRLDVGDEEVEKFKNDLRKAGFIVDEKGGSDSELTNQGQLKIGKTGDASDFSLVLEDGRLIKGYDAVAAYIKAHMDPDKFKANFERIFKDYYHPMDAPDFERRSNEKAKELRKMALRNMEVVEMISNILQSKAGRRVTRILSENIIKAANSPSAPLIRKGFELWRNGRKKEALAFFEEADKKDPSTHYVQIVSHHAKAFLKNSMRKPLGDIMEEYFELGRESKKYFANFRPVIQDLGYDPKKLYGGRDPFVDHKDFPNNKRMKEVVRGPWDEIIKASKPELEKLDKAAKKEIAVLEKFFGKNGSKIKSGNVEVKAADVPELMSAMKKLEELNRPLFEELENQKIEPGPEGSTFKVRDREIWIRKQQDKFNKEYNIK